MRKFVIAIFSVLMLASLFCACGEKTETKHNLVEVPAKAVTCMEDGWNAYIHCTDEGCGYTTKNPIKALGHDIRSVEAKAASCGEEGYDAYEYCAREGCDYQTEHKTYAALEHKIVKVAAKAATCTEDGWNAHEECANGCGYTTAEIIKAKGHEFKEVPAKEPTCDEAGYAAYRYCTNEGCKYTEKKEIKALGHDMKNGICTRCKKGTDALVDFVVRVPAGKEPVVLQLTDPQIIDPSQDRTKRLSAGEAEFYSKKHINEHCYDYITETINKIKPDLIILTGDLVYGEFDDNGSVFKEFVEFMDKFGVPWAPVFGNHEGTSAMGIDWQCEQFVNAKNCLFVQRELTGNGNYSVGIMQGETITRVFYMLDTNGCGDLHANSLVNGHTTSAVGLAADQVEWYTASAKQIKECVSNVKFSFAFHIQPSVFAKGLAKYGFPGSVPINVYKAENREEGEFGYVGRGLKGSWDPYLTIFNGMKELGADSIFVGHEHNNSSSVVYEGVRLQYGQKSSEYDRYVGVNEETLVFDGNYPPKSGNITPLIGGTVIPLGTEGELKTPYIYLCEKAGGKVNWEGKKLLSVDGLKFGSEFTADSALTVKTVETGGVNAYEITATEQGKLFISTALLGGKTSFSFDLFLPNTSCQKLRGLGELAVRVKAAAYNGYIDFNSSSDKEERKIVFDKWKTFTEELSSFGSITELSIVLPKGSVAYIKSLKLL